MSASSVRDAVATEPTIEHWRLALSAVLAWGCRAGLETRQLIEIVEDEIEALRGDVIKDNLERYNVASNSMVETIKKQGR